ncbi:glycosyltransferase family 4 protein [Pseudomonas mangiferae]|uniref:Glycosyltransferase family 4 protein n=1 Tax=Pseudomonas mangiferae TaxID=2593654 RepID=A0A553GWA1_9PSED|nr:glycosyltransferase family 4 protein [Pseudomonas mangiferae]TRX73778.1 glycosyltransferase family 4 protein [Pseudomonas mangiferae]
MRILILSQYFWPENFRINELAVELAARGHQICVLTGRPNYPQGEVYAEYRHDPEAWSKLGGIEVLRVPMLPRHRGAVRLILNYVSFALGASVAGAWKLRGRQFDRILVFQPSPATIGLPSVVLRSLKRAPTVFWVQDLWPDTLEAIGVVRSRLALKLVDRFVSWVYSHSDHVLAQSQAFIPRLRRQSPPGLPISYLPNWAEAPRKPAELACETPPEHGPHFKVFYLGNFGEAQDFPAVLDAIELLKAREDIHWHLVGDGRIAGWLRSEIARRGLSERVSMPGAFPPEEMPRFHRQADALLVSLKSDPLFALTIPSKVQSYLAAGVPIVAMLDGEGARVIRDAEAGLTCGSGDSRGLAEAVEQLARMDPQARARLGESARQYSRREFDFQRLVDRLEDLLANTGPGKLPEELSRPVR